ncbi:C13 family peptidase [Propionivibrio sp.]|uniref:C13 family peptidase n=1 Tax=Propionivibrio sp. TaxID=2212460 RepID=UPI002638E147|nr:C13 family peptidase [Propionivibrio sp.]
MTESSKADPALCSVPPATVREADLSGSVRSLFSDAARSAVFLRPRWRNLPASPLLVARLTVLNLLVIVLAERLMIVGDATFYWRAIASGWFAFAAIAWICYLMRPIPAAPNAGEGASSSVQLVCLALTQSVLINLAFTGGYAALVRSEFYNSGSLGSAGQWAVFLAPQIWLFIAQLLMIWRGGNRHKVSMLAAGIVAAYSLMLASTADVMQFWYPDLPAEPRSERKRLTLTQERMEAQPVLFAQRLAEVQPQRPEIVDLYAITFAPYSDEDVFHHESAMVAEVMAKRFDAKGRGVQLVNHVDTIDALAWATNLNLKRAIQGMASVMDKDNDILFMHLTSHGGSGGKLSASFWPMDVAPLTAVDLRAWLDEAGIRNRVISISACYSGSWIESLANDDTLVMTASDADHTSYGCGRKSALTFYGRALFDEQLRTQTLSFEAAHAAIRPIIKQREEAAGKDDGYSNPQIKVGANIRERLAQLQRRLEAVTN